MIPYVYEITELSTGMRYIGTRTGKGCYPEEFGVKYFTSSKIVKPKLIENPDGWTLEILGTGTSKEMIALETKLLKEVDAANHPGYYNQHNGDGKFDATGKKRSPKSIEKGRLKLLGRKRPPEVIEKMRATKAKKYPKKIKPPKPPKPIKVKKILPPKGPHKSIGIPKTLEHRKKISLGQKGRTSAMKGKKNPGLSKALKGKTYAEIMGPEKAAILLEKRRLANLGKKRKSQNEVL
jgi:hypothetical protein